MTIAFTFPGQGSQSVGMGRDLADAFPACREVFEEVDAALGENLCRLIWEGPEDQLTLTANAQPALMAVSMAVVRALESGGYRIWDNARYVAGHSLGEYSAHAAAGTFSLADAARLLRIRGNAMQAAVPVGQGAMAAILGLDSDAVSDLCEKAGALGACQIANDNGGGQIVVSGAKAAVEAAAEASRDRGAKRAVMLPVSAPFHSALMAPAAETMAEALETVRMTKPVLPVIANVRVAPVTETADIVDTLVAQVTGRVRWRETVQWLASNGIETVVEAGAGKVLTGLARRIDRNLTGIALSTPADIEAFLKQNA